MGFFALVMVVLDWVGVFFGRCGRFLGGEGGWWGFLFVGDLDICW